MLIGDESLAFAAALNLPPLGWEAASILREKHNASFSLVGKHLSASSIHLCFYLSGFSFLFSDLLVVPVDPFPSPKYFYVVCELSDLNQIEHLLFVYFCATPLTCIFFSGGWNIVVVKWAQTFLVSLCALVSELQLNGCGICLHQCNFSTRTIILCECSSFSVEGITQTVNYPPNSY